MYLALRAMMESHRAEAIAMNCLGGVYSGRTHAYPCLGFFQLDSDGRAVRDLCALAGFTRIPEA